MKTVDWLIVVVATFSAIFLGMVFASVAPVLPAVSDYFGGGKEGAFVAQWLLAMPSIGVIVGGPLSGWFIERFGARRILVIGLTAFTLAGGAMLVLENIPALLASRFIVGLSATGQLTAIVSIVGQRYVGELRGKMVGLQSSFATGGSVLVVLSAGALAERYGWRAPSVLYFLAIPILLVSVSIFDADRPAPNFEYKRQVRSLLPLLPSYLLISTVMMVSFISTSQVPLLLAGDGISSASTLSKVIGVTTFAIAVGAFFYGRLRAKFYGSATLAIALALLGLGLLGLSIAHGVVFVATASAVLGVGGGILTPFFSHHILDQAPEAIRGRAVGLLFAAQFAGPILNTALVVPAMAAFGQRETMTVIAVLLFALTSIIAVRRNYVTADSRGH